MNRYDRACVMTHDMPFIDLVFDANPVNLFCEMAQKVRVVWFARRVSQPRQIYGNAGVSFAEAIDDTLPQAAAGGHAMNEEDGFAGTATNYVHTNPPPGLSIQSAFMRWHTPRQPGATD